VVLMDINIEGDIDGIETAARIPTQYGAAVIYLTAYSEQATLDRARTTNPYGYLVKPFSERELHATIQMALGRFQSDSALAQTSERLRAATEAADAANRAKSEFLANMSHELRTPLNAILGFSEMIKFEMFGPVSERYRGYAADIFDSGSYLLKLISEILDLSKLERGKFQLHEEQFDIAELIGTCLHLIKVEAQRLKVRVCSALDQDLPLLRADCCRMQQVLLNLLSNAVKFTPPGGEVRVSGFMRSNGLTIAVCDTGVGIAEDDIPIAMASFGQIESHLSRKHKGSGLGLPLAKHLVELHGGTLTLESQVGIGTTVTIVLPAARTIQ